MAPSRFRKRASTLRTVELLNNLSHGSEKRAPSRQSKADTEGPRSDDVWDMMDMPESEGGVEGGRRRSRRIRQSRGSRGSTGVGTEPDMSTKMGDTGEDEGEDEDEEQQEQNENEQGQEEEEEEEEEQEQEQDEDQDKEDHDHDPDDMLYMFSDDENEARRSQSQQKSPGRDSVQSEQQTTSYGEDRDGSRSSLSGSRPPEVHIHVGGRESIQHDEPIQHDESTDNDPVFAPESSSSASSSSSESESQLGPESSQLHKRRRVVQQNKDRSRHVRISPHEEDADAGGVGHQARDLQWMEKAMNLGQQRDNWLVMTTTAKELSRMADDPDGAECDDICALIRGLRRLYGDMDGSTRPSTATLTQGDNLFTRVSSAADKLLDRVYYLATDDGPGGSAQDLMDAFDARVVPGLVRLVIVCFQVYYTAPLLFSRLPDNLLRILLLLRGLWVRTTSMKAQRIVHGGGGGAAVRHGKAFGQAIHGIIQALETGALRHRDLARNDDKYDDYSQNVREWTRDEGLALIDGLQLYQGMVFISFSRIGFYECFSVQGN